MGERERYAIILSPEQLCCLLGIADFIEENAPEVAFPLGCTLPDFLETHLAIAEDAASSINSEEVKPWH